MKKHKQNRMSFRRLPERAQRLVSYCKRFNQSGDHVSAALELADLAACGTRCTCLSVDVVTSPLLDRVIQLQIMRTWHLIASNTVIAMDSPETKKGATACLKRAQLGWVTGSDSIEVADRMLERIKAIRDNKPEQERYKQKKFSLSQEFAWLQKHADN
jgi:hypothetical protein